MVTEDRKVVVIGSGPAGAMAAHELVRAGIPTVMLESGAECPGGVLIRLMSRNLFRIKAEAHQEHGNGHRFSGDPMTTWFHFRGLGGLSNQWTGAVPRFAPEDFSEGERLHERYRWPLDYADLTHFYEKVERLLDVNGAPADVPNLPAGRPTYPSQLPDDWEHIARFAARRGQGMTVLPLADGAPWMLVRRGTAFNSFSTIVRPLLTSDKFELVKGAHALRLEWSGRERRVNSVVYYDRTTRSERRISAAAVVVACGALHSTKLLFDSSCPDFPQGLGNTEGLLGRYLHDHAREWWLADLERPITRLAQAAYLTRLPYDKSPPLLGASWTIHVATTTDKLLSLTPLKGRTVGVQVLGTTIPTEGHLVRSSPDAKDEFGLPRLEINMRYDDTVVGNMLDARQRFAELLTAAGYPCNVRPVEPQLHPGSSVHYGGTVRMHASRRHGVLDGWNRMHDVPNVFVTDASSFTTGPEKNPTLTVMALAARAAHKLVGDLHRGDHGSV